MTVLETFSALLLGTLGILQSAHANPGCKAALSVAFAELHSISRYFEGECDTNALELAIELDRQGFRASDTSIVIIRLQRDYYLGNSTVIARNTRIPHRSPEWNWHVVVERDGKILDMDHAKDEPLGPREHFLTMFTDGHGYLNELLLEQLEVKSIPLNDILNLNRPIAWFIHNNRHYYWQNALEYIEEIEEF